jgi:hypothetical protein
MPDSLPITGRVRWGEREVYGGSEVGTASHVASSVKLQAGAVLSPFDRLIPERQLRAGVEACHAVAYQWLISGF